MNDRELLELAAKAAMGSGLKLECPDDPDGVYVARPAGRVWNPLADDGDALRLAVRLSMLCEFSCSGMTVEASNGPGPVSEFEDYRRAIVRAAAEIGRALP